MSVAWWRGDGLQPTTGWVCVFRACLTLLACLQLLPSKFLDEGFCVGELLRGRMHVYSRFNVLQIIVTGLLNSLSFRNSPIPPVWLRPLVFGSKFVSIVALTRRPGILRVEATITVVFMSGPNRTLNTPNIARDNPDSTQRAVYTTYGRKEVRQLRCCRGNGNRVMVLNFLALWLRPEDSLVFGSKLSALWP